MDIKIKKLEGNAAVTRSLHLAEDVFIEFEAPAGSSESVESFRALLYGEKLQKLRDDGDIFFFGACAGDELIGMCAVRNRNHITLLFVDGKHHRRGVGSALLDVSLKHANGLYGTRIFTVNASAFGLPFYKKLGFIPTDMERIENGILYTPMIYTLVVNK